MSRRWRQGLSYEIDKDTPGMDFTWEWGDWLAGVSIKEFSVFATDGIEVVTAVQDEVGGDDITAVIKRSETANAFDTVTCRVIRDTDPETGTDRSITIRWVDK